jgi:glutamate racemase
MAAIGVFDSGVGGLTVVAALARRLPTESILYLGDTARLPYGTKSETTVTRYTRRNVDFLVEREVKAVVVACNTASALALPTLEAEEHGGVPLFGVIEPGAEEAVAASRGRVGVIATESTARSDAYARAIRRRAPELEVVTVACPLLVPLVEEGWHEDPITVEVTRRYLEPLLATGIDTLVLGCTHYPLLRAVLAGIVGPEVTLIDSAEATASRVATALERAGLAGGEPGDRSHFCHTDSISRVQRNAGAVRGREDLTIELVDVA